MSKTEDRGSGMALGSDPALLSELCGGDVKLYNILSYLLLLEPKRQIPQLGGVDDLVVQAEAALKRDNGTRARVYLETAARIGIYAGDEKVAQDMLNRAQKAAPMRDAPYTDEQVISALPRIMAIAGSYYERLGQLAAETAKSGE